MKTGEALLLVGAGLLGLWLLSRRGEEGGAAFALSIELPSFEFPSIEFPTFEFPSIEFPTFEFPEFPEIDIPELGTILPELTGIPRLIRQVQDLFTPEAAPEAIQLTPRAAVIAESLGIEPYEWQPVGLERLWRAIKLQTGLTPIIQAETVRIERPAIGLTPYAQEILERYGISY